MTPMVAALLFDLMGTVVYDPYREALEAATGLGLADAHHIKDPDSWPLFETGVIDETEFVRRFFSDPGAGHALDIDAFHRVRRDGYRWLPGIAELLADLDGRVRRYIASNYPVWIDELHATFEFDRHFDGVYASCRMGVRKPDPAFYQAVIADLRLPADDCLFIDDREINCRAAAAAGMRVHHFDGAGPLRRRLVSEGVLQD